MTIDKMEQHLLALEQVLLNYEIRRLQAMEALEQGRTDDAWSILNALAWTT